MSSGDFKVHLQHELLKRCSHNPGYSMRAFARSLKVDYSTLSKLLRGERAIGKQLVARLGNRLGMTPEELNPFLSSFGSRNGSGDDAAFSLIAVDTFKIISDWYHFAILELMRVDGFVSDTQAVARSLGLTTHEVQAALDRLVRAEMIQIDPQNRWIDITGGRTTNIGPEMRSNAHRQLQRQLLEKAIAAMELTPMDQRHQSGMTMAIDHSKLPLAEKKIKKFRRDLSTLLSRGKKRTQVYHLGISLYPVSKRKEGKKRK